MVTYRVFVRMVSPSSWSLATSVAQHFWVPSFTFERIYQFRSKFTKGLSIVKYRSSANLKIIGEILTELCPFLDLSFSHAIHQ